MEENLETNNKFNNETSDNTNSSNLNKLEESKSA